MNTVQTLQGISMIFCKVIFALFIEKQFVKNRTLIENRKTAFRYSEKHFKKFLVLKYLKPLNSFKRTIKFVASLVYLQDIQKYPAILLPIEKIVSYNATENP